MSAIKESETKIQMDDQSFIPSPKGPFSDNEVRNGFIRKVNGILFVQLLFTIIVSGIVFTLDQTEFKRIRERKDTTNMTVICLLLVISFIALVVVPIIFCCPESARRTVPTNFILLGIFEKTVCVAIICAQHYGENIFIAFSITGVVVASITLLATTPWFDITHCGCLLCILVLVHMVMTIVMYLKFYALGLEVRPLYFALAVFGSFLWSLILLYDTQLILGDKKYEMSPEEYVYGAIGLYIDIILTIVLTNNRFY